MDFSKIRNFLFLGLLGLVTFTFLYMIKIFAYPIFWAAIIAGIFHPLYRWLNRHLKSPSLSSALILIVVFLVIVIPLFVIGTLVVRESMDIYATTNDNRGQIVTMVQGTMDWFKHNPYTARFNINESFWTEKFTDIAKTITDFLLNSAKNFTENSLVFIIMFVITFYTLFFFVCDGEKILLKIMRLCPLGDKYEKMLYHKFTSTVSATLKGSLIIGLIQGILGGLMFFVVGIKGVFIWFLLMALLTIMGIGSFPIWLPVAVVMLLLDKVWQGVFMIIFGTLVMGAIDNLLRPILVGKDAQMHPLWVFLSTLGGIAVFGISGFIIGPVIAALFLSFWEIYEEYYKNELDHN